MKIISSVTRPGQPCPPSPVLATSGRSHVTPGGPVHARPAAGTSRCGKKSAISPPAASAGENGGTPFPGGGTPSAVGGAPTGDSAAPICDGGAPIPGFGPPISAGGAPIFTGGAPAAVGGAPISASGAPTAVGGAPISEKPPVFPPPGPWVCPFNPITAIQP